MYFNYLYFNYFTTLRRIAAEAYMTGAPCRKPAAHDHVKNDAIPSSADPQISNLSRSRRNKMLWSTQSNAALRSISPSMVTC